MNIFLESLIVGIIGGIEFISLNMFFDYISNGGDL